jgi:hypothetical protein
VEAYIDAAVRHNVHFILLLTGLFSEMHATSISGEYRAMEQYLEHSHIPHVTLRCAGLQQVFLLQSHNVRDTNTLVIPTCSSPVALVNVMDVARIAASILTRPTDHYGQVYALLGPEWLGVEEIAASAKEGLGRDIQVKEVDEGEFCKVLQGLGEDKDKVEVVVDAWASSRQDRVQGQFKQELFEREAGEHGVPLCEFFRMNSALFASKGKKKEVAKGASALAAVAGVGEKAGGDKDQIIEQIVHVLDLLTNHVECALVNMQQANTNELQCLEPVKQAVKELKTATGIPQQEEPLESYGKTEVAATEKEW